MSLILIAVIGAYLLALVVLGYAIHISVIYQRFNDGIKDWAKSLDESTRAAIDRQAMEILRELDARLSEGKQEETNVEFLNTNDNE